ncbi:MAG TPA: RNA methyltransferase [Polyangia bacterium]|nr:RNA methyltransferase [Polyangia bacterium]
MTPEVHIALLHYPVLNKAGEIVATAVTNLDIHDNARSARTFRCASFHLVTPLDAQVELVSRILGHWRDGFGARRVPNRVDAINLVRVSRDVDSMIEAVQGNRPERPVLIATAARRLRKTAAHAELRARMADDPGPYILVFGTGYGLAEAVIDRAEAVLEPIGEPEDWNHLSVRSAVAITLDRLLGAR